VRHLLLATVICTLAATTPLKAQSYMPIRAPVGALPATGWGGAYVGVNVGQVRSIGNTIDNSAADTDGEGLGALFAAGGAPTAITLGYSGILAGAQVGYNWQMTRLFVVGVETDFQGTGRVGNAFATTASPAIFFPNTTFFSRELDWVGTFRGRLGITPIAPLFLYATGGLAYGKHQFALGDTATTVTPAINGFNQVSNTNAGWALGGGAEWKFAPNWSLKAEYLVVDLGSLSSTVGYLYPGNSSSLTAIVRDREQIVRVGLNYRFGWGFW
jgi:outer membrane immunogenic protein